MGIVHRLGKSEYLGCFCHGCPYMPNRHEPIGNTGETLLSRYEETMARLQIRDAGYKVVSIGCASLRNNCATVLA
jgi:hypothetical protein